jgi:hypothetical protein
MVCKSISSNHPFIYPSICLYIYLTILLSICPFTYLYINPSIHLSIYTPINLYTYPSIHLSIYRPINLYTNPYIHLSKRSSFIQSVSQSACVIIILIYLTQIRPQRSGKSVDYTNPEFGGLKPAATVVDGMDKL